MNLCEASSPFCTLNRVPKVRPPRKQLAVFVALSDVGPVSDKDLPVSVQNSHSKARPRSPHWALLILTFHGS